MKAQMSGFSQKQKDALLKMAKADSNLRHLVAENGEEESKARALEEKDKNELLKASNLSDTLGKEAALVNNASLALAKKSHDMSSMTKEAERDDAKLKGLEGQERGIESGAKDMDKKLDSMDGTTKKYQKEEYELNKKSA